MKKNVFTKRRNRKWVRAWKKSKRLFTKLGIQNTTKSNMRDFLEPL